jgi:hypothetical protein
VNSWFLNNHSVTVDGIQCSQVYGFACDLVQYLIEQGPVIEDGDTVGRNGDQKIVVHHAPSMLNRGELVYKLAF